MASPGSYDLTPPGPIPWRFRCHAPTAARLARTLWRLARLGVALTGTLTGRYLSRSSAAPMQL